MRTYHCRAGTGPSCKQRSPHLCDGTGNVYLSEEENLSVAGWNSSYFVTGWVGNRASTAEKNSITHSPRQQNRLTPRYSRQEPSVLSIQDAAVPRVSQNQLNPSCHGAVLVYHNNVDIISGPNIPFLNFWCDPHPTTALYEFCMIGLIFLSCTPGCDPLPNTVLYEFCRSGLNTPLLYSWCDSLPTIVLYDFCKSGPNIPLLYSCCDHHPPLIFRSSYRDLPSPQNGYVQDRVE
ncbi:hypothetical protein J6590_069196 [Homalodisca vitripennis]|nr:hypothetical protein J6590_069196 [Homalodisca vitripennis]